MNIAVAAGALVLVVPAVAFWLGGWRRRVRGGDASPASATVVSPAQSTSPVVTSSGMAIAQREAPAASAGGHQHLSVDERHRSRLRFADVAGLDTAIDELREIAEYLSDPARFQALGATMPKGILLYGPPGCGKTMLARALAGETGVPFYSVSAASFVEQYVGLGAARVRELFEAAERHAPSIIFIDELDAIGRNRNDSSGGTAEFDHTLNQLLVDLDGFRGSRGTLIVGATNRIELLDPALLRPGRFDRRISVDRPDREGREQILRLHARRRPFSAFVDWGQIAVQTVGLAPSELANIVNESALLAARRHSTTIEAEDVEEASVRQLSGSLGSDGIDDKSRWLIALHEAGHALLAHRLRGIVLPPRVSIVSRATTSDSSNWCPTEAREVLTKRDLLARLVLLLGGRAAELNVFGEPSTQGEDDLGHAATLARQMVERWGMTGRFELAGGRRPDNGIYLEGSAGGDEVRRLIAGAEVKARSILADNRRPLLNLARALGERESLSSGQVATVIAGSVLPARRSPPPIRRAEAPRMGTDRLPDVVS